MTDRMRYMDGMENLMEPGFSCGLLNEALEHVEIAS